MDKRECCCSEKKPDLTCSACDTEEQLQYWCATCQRQVAEKRCHDCGLKTSKVHR